MVNQKYFVVIDHHELDLRKYNLRQYGRISQFNFVEFTVRALDNPLTEPICVYYEDGVRKYLWKEKCWMEIEVSTEWLKRELLRLINNSTNDVEVIGLQSLLKCVDKYKRSTSPTELDNVDTADLAVYASKSFSRILYEINPV